MEKTHLSKILEKKIKKIKIINEENINDAIISEITNYDCLIIDNYKNKLMKIYFIQF